jgi:hypothetical protein
MCSRVEGVYPYVGIGFETVGLIFPTKTVGLTLFNPRLEFIVHPLRGDGLYLLFEEVSGLSSKLSPM